ncbi:MAG: hypothetical protein J2P31_09825 [Blastocatellia bacterium]|nr:hypothetical protein [Blastocatellia bacterium]MBO0799107.1 hypothetical protein [Blastocatellia bacterium]
MSYVSSTRRHWTRESTVAAMRDDLEEPATSRETEWTALLRSLLRHLWEKP